MLFEEVEKLYIVKDGVIYTPITSCERKVDENGNVYGDHTVIKTAEEVCQECMNPPIQEPTTEERLKAIEQYLLTL